MTPLSKSQYRNLHHWLDRNFEKPDKCEGQNCTGLSDRLDWALKKGFAYEKKRENYLVLCKSCHTRYDFSEETRKKQAENARRTLNGYKKGHKYHPHKNGITEEYRAKMPAIALARGYRPPSRKKNPQSAIASENIQ